MARVSSSTHVGAVRHLEKCRRFSGAPTEFWSSFLEALASLVGARRALLLLRSKDDGSDWRVVQAWPGRAGVATPVPLGSAEFQTRAHEALQDGTSVLGGGEAILLALDAGDESREGLVLVDLDGSGASVDPARRQLALAADTASLYQRERLLERARGDLEHFSSALDVMVLLNQQTRFLAAAMTLCNETCSRHRCNRVSLGWLEGRHVRVRAISHLDRFEKKMDIVQYLEAVMEEALDQDTEITWPAPEDAPHVSRDHGAFAHSGGSTCLASIPVRIQGEPRAVLTLERADEPFGEGETRGLRVLADQAARRLDDLHGTDRWFGARWVGAAGRALGWVLGPRHAWAKLAALAGAAALGVLFFGSMHYRVEGDFILRSDDLQHLPAPFDGFIDAVHVRLGDTVAAGDVLVELDTTEERLQESQALAQIRQFQVEADLAEAERRLADKRRAEAQRQQAEEELKRIRHRLSRSSVRAPFDGVVVEGDLRDRVGARVSPADTLIEITRLDSLYVEVKVPERDGHEIIDSATGEVAFAALPERRFPVRLERIEPVAVSETEGNVFIVRAAPVTPPEAWWRPGMAGVAKLDVGRRRLLWIATHRLVDFVRLELWL